MPYVKADLFSETLSGITGAPVGEPMLPFIWAHQGFKGAYRNAMSRDRDGVSFSALPERHLVVAGHYHLPQNLGRVIYCGSPYEMSFAEEGQQKGWLRWDDPFADPLPVRIAFGQLGAAKHYTVHWNPADGPPKPPDKITQQDKVRIITQATRKEALAESAQLVDAGLEGVVIPPRTEHASQRGVVRPGMGPIQAAIGYTLANPDRFDPVEMETFAQEEGLWEAIRL